jgi:hypothetical protein
MVPRQHVAQWCFILSFHAPVGRHRRTKMVYFQSRRHRCRPHGLSLPTMAGRINKADTMQLGLRIICNPADQRNLPNIVVVIVPKGFAKQIIAGL